MIVDVFYKRGSRDAWQRTTYYNFSYEELVKVRAQYEKAHSDFQITDLQIIVDNRR